MDKNTKETLLKVADFTKEKEAIFTRRIHAIFNMGIAAYSLMIVIHHIGIESPVADFLKGLFIGISLGTLLFGSLLTSSLGPKLMAAKQNFIRKIIYKENK